MLKGQDLPGKQYLLIDFSNWKNPVRCSGHSVKSRLIIASVHSNTASRTAGICGIKWDCNLPTIAFVTFNTSASRAAGTFRL